MPIELLGLTLEALRRLAVEWGEPPYRGNQLYHALYAEECLEFSRMTSLPRGLRARLEREACLTPPRVEKRYTSADGTIRYLLRLPAATGDELSSDEGRSVPPERGDSSSSSVSVETVWMPEAARQTLCLSTQAGCAVDCHFCATAQLGLLRNLSAREIVGQVLVARADHRRHLRPSTNIVLMGQGEPLLNYDATLRAVRLLADPAGMSIPLKSITLSTVGIIPGIRRLAEEEVRPRLAVSLSATTEEQRNALMPINRKYPLGELLEVCRQYPLRLRERLTFEYVLVGGFNDTPADARRLAQLLAGLRAKVNLIPWNPAPGLPYCAPDEVRVADFQRTLRQAGRLAFIRRPRGQDIFAACGQLASWETSTPAPV
ncbi:MAG: 23S rRNA (adenine(2503)-C(2))-methyltransferase RlmN [Terriglobia bacterium]